MKFAVISAVKRACKGVNRQVSYAREAPKTVTNEGKGKEKKKERGEGKEEKRKKQWLYS